MKKILVLTLLLSLIFIPSLLAGEVKHQFEDGAAIRIIPGSGTPEGYSEEVLGAAIAAYEKVVNEIGFDREGYTFASSDKAYAYDGDRIIDIHIGKGGAFEKGPVTEIGYKGRYEYMTTILIPAEFGNGNRLEGALVHEMTNVILFYYNRGINLFKENAWCVDGLARYFETLAGYQENFNAIKVSPGQEITKLGYEAALFWKYFHSRFGIEVIEEVSCRLRQARNNEDATKIIEKVTSVSFQELSEHYYNQ